MRVLQPPRRSLYRERLDTDGLSPEGVYVGTSNGQLFATVRAGEELAPPPRHPAAYPFRDGRIAPDAARYI